MDTSKYPIHESAADTDEGLKVIIDYFTDPLCSWSWAFEAPWRRLRYEFGDHLAFRYRMGGMIADWQTYNDPLNAVSRPLQMGPQWIEVHHLTGAPLNEKIWVHDPPGSSHPACIAVKAAAIQSAQAEEALLRSLREAVMLHQRNISRKDVLLELGRELALRHPEYFDLDRFVDDLDGKEAVDAFRRDLQESRYLGIGRFPTLLLGTGESRRLVLIGYRPFDHLERALKQIAPQIQRSRTVTDTEAYRSFWGTVTDREIKEVL